MIPKSLNDGWWIDPADGNNVIQCNPPDACPIWDTVEQVLSGNCTVGYKDKVAGCKECEVQFYRSLQDGGGLCKACPEMPVWVWIFGGLALLMLLPLLLKASKLKNGFGAINIFISYAQVLSMFRKLNFEWPIRLTNMLRDLSIFNLNFFTISPPECLSSNWSYINKFW